MKLIKLSLVCLFLSCFFSLAALAQNDKSLPPRLCVKGVISSEDKPLAVINDQVLGEGDNAGEVKVLKISSSGVYFEYQGDTFFREIGQDCKGPVISIQDISKVRSKTGKTGLAGVLENLDGAKTPKQVKTIIMPIFRGMMAVLWAVWLVVYAFCAICLQVMANKTNTELGWLAWIPLANLYLMCKIAGKPGWWTLLFFVPFVGLIATIVIWVGIADARGKPGWMGAFIILPVLNFGLMGYLAFTE